MLEEDDIQPPEAKYTPVGNAVPVSETRPVARNKVCPADNEEDNSGTSDKKDDWKQLKNSSLEFYRNVFPTYS